MRDARMAAANDRSTETETMDPPRSKSETKRRKAQTEDKETELVNVKASKNYRLIYPKDEKLLNNDFKVPASKLGKLAKDYVVLNMASEEIDSDCRAVGRQLVELFDESRVADIKIQVGRNVFTLQRHSVAAKEEVKIKK